MLLKMFWSKSNESTFPISANSIDHQIMPLCDFKFVCRFSSLNFSSFLCSRFRFTTFPSLCYATHNVEHIVLFYSILKAHFIYFFIVFLVSTYKFTQVILRISSVEGYIKLIRYACASCVNMENLLFP